MSEHTESRHRRPPSLAEAMLRRALPRDPLGHSVIGDLREEFHRRAESRLIAARGWYWREALAIFAHRMSDCLSARARFAHNPPGTRGMPIEPPGAHGKQRNGPRRETLHSIASDVKYALRSFRRSPGLVAVAVISLGVGIGANVTVFSMADVYLFRLLPFPEADRLVHVYKTMPERGWTYNQVSIPDLLDFREQSRTMDIAASYGRDVNLSGTDRPERVDAERSSWNWFQVLRVQPVLGRVFKPEEEEEGRHRVAVISERLWQRRFGSDPSTLGQTIQLDAEPYTVIGILPADFRFGLGYTEVWTPFGLTGDESRGSNVLQPVGRLLPGATLEQANVELSTIAERLAEVYPESHEGWSAGARELHRQTPEETRMGLLVLLVAAAFVLLIVCSNVANLLLTRAAGRVREIAVRGALGASRGRIVRQLLTEAMVVSILGGILGVLLSCAGIRGSIALMPPWVPRLEELGIDGRVLLFAVAVTSLTGIMFGIAPALRNSQPNFSQSLKEGARGVFGTRGNRLRKALAVTQVTLALTLLVGSVLLAKGFFQLQARDHGWEAAGILTFDLALPRSQYRDAESLRGFYHELLPRLEMLPTVESVGGTSHLPLEGNTNTLYDVVGEEAPSPTMRPLAEYRFLLPGYLRTMGISVLRGRTFDHRDRPDTRPVVILNEMLAERHWPGEDPIGKQLSYWGLTREIIGVAENTIDVRHTPTPMIYMSANQSPRNSMSFVLRTAGDPLSLVEGVRVELSAIDPDLPLYDVKTMVTVAREGRELDALLAKMMGVVALVALVLSVIGVYGVISYSVSQRTQEMGIRMALGAGRASVLGLILRQGVVLAGIGVIVGIVTAALVARGLTMFLYGVSPFDISAFGAAVIVLLGASIAASYFPARRVAKLDPLTVLRYE